MTLAIFLTLMYVISLALHKTMIMTVHNKYPGMKLVSPACFCKHGKRYGYHVKRTHTGAVINIDLRFDFDQDVLEGILMYEVRRKRSAKSNHQSSKVIEEASRMMRLLVTWKIERSRKPKVNIMLIEYDNKLVLDEDKLAQLYEKANDTPFGYSLGETFFDYDSDDSSFDSSRRTWLMCDNTVLAAAHEVVREGGLELKIDISQGVENKDAIRPVWIDPTRQVLSLIIIYSC
jgi:hypothetical protein